MKYISVIDGRINTIEGKFYEVLYEAYGNLIIENELGHKVGIEQKLINTLINKGNIMKHQTATGDTMLICQMSDDHLKNTIQMHCKNMISLHEAIVTTQESNVSNLLYNMEVNKEKVKQKLKEIDTILGFYIIEAQIRGMNFSDDLQKAYGRKIGVGGNTFILSAMNNSESLSGGSYSCDDYEGFDN